MLSFLDRISVTVAHAEQEG